MPRTYKISYNKILSKKVCVRNEKTEKLTIFNAVKITKMI